MDQLEGFWKLEPEGRKDQDLATSKGHFTTNTVAEIEEENRHKSKSSGKVGEAIDAEKPPQISPGRPEFSDNRYPVMRARLE